MYIRCLDCQSSTWIESVEPGSVAQGVSCRACGREYALEVPADLGATQKDQYQKALSFAEGHGIDLPSAYSVLLGIMSADEARGLREQAVSEQTKEAAARIAARKARAAAAARPLATGDRRQAPTPPQAEPGLVQGPSYDPGFRRAVRDGALTAPQALERGNRKLMASRLSRAHRLSRRLAYEVADNRIGLQDALRQQAERKSPLAGHRSIRLSPRQRNWITGIVSVAFMVLAVNGVCLWHGYAEEAEAAKGLTQVVSQQTATVPEPQPPKPDGPGRAVEATEVQTDDSGRILAVAGPNPREVLIRYCRAASSSTRFEPVELTSTVPPFPGTRLGLFRELGNLNSLLAIKIRRESRSHRWVTGDGNRPIVAVEAPQLPADADRIPVSLR